MILKFLIIIGVVYFSILIFLFVFQRNILFVPDRSAPSLTETNVPEMSEVSIETKDGLSLTSWFYRGKVEKPLIIYFQGNAGNISDRDYKARFLIDNDYSVLLLGYRGYGGNKGQPSEEGLRKDGEAALEFASREGFEASNIILYGESLGTGVVVDLVTRAKFKGMVLEAPYTSIEALAKKRYWFIPVSYLLKDKFDSINKVSQLTSPTLVLHGDSDKVINLDYGQQLYDATPQPKNFVMFPGGGHSNLFDFGAGTEIVTFMNSLE